MPIPASPPDARCAEFVAGKEGGGMLSKSSSSSCIDGTADWAGDPARGVLSPSSRKVNVGGDGGGDTTSTGIWWRTIGAELDDDVDDEPEAKEDKNGHIVESGVRRRRWNRGSNEYDVGVDGGVER